MWYPMLLLLLLLLLVTINCNSSNNPCGTLCYNIQIKWAHTQSILSISTWFSLQFTRDSSSRRGGKERRENTKGSSFGINLLEWLQKMLLFILFKKKLFLLLWESWYEIYPPNTFLSVHYCWLDWKKHKLESKLLGEIPITSDMQMTPPLWHKVKRN